MKNIVVIPVYKKTLSDAEKASFIQCLKILDNIFLIAPNSLDLDEYQKIAALQNKQIYIKRFNNKHFKNVSTYSKLLVDSNFYKKFQKYDYMLIYQLDAWVFKDDLNFWCKQGYDYIGAPWFEGFDKASEHVKMLPYAGNGGFSLRNIKSMIKLLSTKFTKTFDEIFNKMKKKRSILNIINYPIFILKFLFQRKKRLYDIMETTPINEDLLIVKYSKKMLNFRVAPPKIALNFSFEVNPQVCYELNNKNLPFGCHAFKKHTPKFWEQFINENENLSVFNNN